MNSRYAFKEIEQKWRKVWEQNPINKEDDKKPRFYCLDMFPYPSGTGLHVGHWRGYVLSDVVSRRISTADNIANVKRQLHEISAIYDWDREVNTTDPSYYKWTQWIFVQMFKKGLAYEKEMPLNWCPSCKCVLANEEATNGVCERCGTVVTKKNLRQWMLKITAYADRLLADLSKLDWPAKVKKMQSDWIGKSYGAEVSFKVKDSDKEIIVYTTRPDTLYGATFMVLSPEYKDVKELTTPEQKEAMEKYCFEASTKSSVDRITNKEKTGVFTAHDDRDFEFAKKFDLPIIQVILKEGEEEKELEEAYTGDGIMINSGDWNGMKAFDAKEKAPHYLEEKGLGKKTINYKGK